MIGQNIPFDPGVYKLLGSKRISAHRTLLVDKTILTDALFDSGAAPSSYVSKDFIFRNGLEHKVKTSRGACPKQADGSVIRILGNITLEVVHNARSYMLDFEVTTISEDMIIGLLHLALYFQDVVLQILQEIAYIANTTINANNSALQVLNGELIPWDPVPDAPEHADIPEAIQFADFLGFMSMSRTEAIDEYRSLFHSHIHPDFLTAVPAILDYLENVAVQAFIPIAWTGIAIEPFHIEFRPDTPLKLKPPTRYVNPKLLTAAKSEFDRLSTYMYEPSVSPIASPLVIAPKATPPYLRFCGDYVTINKYMVVSQYPIPNIKHSLFKLSAFKHFLDIDLTNAFHQVPIDQATSAMLSVQTPWGQVQPRFLPEGIAPATQKMHKTVHEIFVTPQTEDWIVQIHDNILVGCLDYTDAFNKLKVVVDLAIKFRVALKFKKTFLGYPEAEFFGYICGHGGHKLSLKRSLAIQSLPFPGTSKKPTKAMQSFLGCTNYFHEFVPHYSTIAAPLYDMTRKDFNWDKSTWTRDYEQDFQHMKDCLNNAQFLYFPNYEWKWILRTDASNFGVGAVLLQEDPQTNLLQPIHHFSQKFSKAAKNWDTIKQECFAIYAAVKALKYLLMAKEFILETDHANLQWMASNENEYIIRMRLYLQNFNFYVKHIPGKQNLYADYLSRTFPNDITTDTDSSLLTLMQFHILINPPTHPSILALQQDILLHDHTILPLYDSDTDTVTYESFRPAEQSESSMAQSSSSRSILCELTSDNSSSLSAWDKIREVHNHKCGHWGIQRTRILLDNKYPNHGIPINRITEFIQECTVCQKVRKYHNPDLMIQPIHRPLPALHFSYCLGIDFFSITPISTKGNTGIYVVRNLLTKLTGIYPAPAHNKDNAALALYTYFSYFGYAEHIISDPGSELMSETVKELNNLLGSKHLVSLVDVHTSNGVERTNGEIKRHLQIWITENRNLQNWDDPVTLATLHLFLNSYPSAETSISAFEATFGSLRATYHQIPKTSNKPASEFLIKLNENLLLQEKIVKEQQHKIQEIRSSNNVNKKFVPGDYVFKIHGKTETKLQPNLLGPYLVKSHYQNDVTVQHPHKNNLEVLHVKDLKLFLGSNEEAIETALIDMDQYFIDKIIDYKGDPSKRTTLSFLVSFKGFETPEWLPLTKDLDGTQQFEHFCNSIQELKLLLRPQSSEYAELTRINKQPISDELPNSTGYINLRAYGHLWFDELKYPPGLYLVPFTYGKLFKQRNRDVIEATFSLPTFDLITLDNATIYKYVYRSIPATHNIYQRIKVINTWPYIPSDI